MTMMTGVMVNRDAGDRFNIAMGCQYIRGFDINSGLGAFSMRRMSRVAMRFGTERCRCGRRHSSFDTAIIGMNVIDVVDRLVVMVVMVTVVMMMMMMVIQVYHCCGCSRILGELFEVIVV